MSLWNDINQPIFVSPFAETRSIKWMWRRLTERIDYVVVSVVFRERLAPGPLWYENFLSVFANKLVIFGVFSWIYT